MDQNARALRGQTSFHAGEAAEQMVGRYYTNQGYEAMAQRWRCASGEIDLIFRTGDIVVFVEVKKSASFAQAALRIGPRQTRRIFNAAQEFLGTQPHGQLTDIRFDAALVNSAGEIKILQNALSEG